MTWDGIVLSWRLDKVHFGSHRLTKNSVPLSSTKSLNFFQVIVLVVWPITLLFCSHQDSGESAALSSNKALINPLFTSFWASNSKQIDVSYSLVNIVKYVVAKEPYSYI